MSHGNSEPTKPNGELHSVRANAELPPPPKVSPLLHCETMRSEGEWDPEIETVKGNGHLPVRNLESTRSLESVKPPDGEVSAVSATSAQLLEEAAQVKRHLKEMFTLAQKQFVGSHEDLLAGELRKTQETLTSGLYRALHQLSAQQEEAISIVTEKLQQAAAVETRAAAVQAENTRLRAALESLRAALDSQSGTQPPSKEPPADGKSEGVRQPQPRILTATPPGEAPPSLMDLSTAASSPLRLPGMLPDEGYDDDLCPTKRSEASSQEAPLRKDRAFDETASCIILGHLPPPSATHKHKAVLRQSTHLVDEGATLLPTDELPRCKKCRTFFLPETTSCHKCGAEHGGAENCKAIDEIARSMPLARSHNKSLDLYKLLPVWTDEKVDHAASMAQNLVMQNVEAGMQTMALSPSGGGMYRAGTSKLNIYDDPLMEVPSCFATGVIHPGNTGRVIWDVSSLVLVNYDIIMIPLDSFFEPPENWFTVFCSWIVRLFWTSDIFLSFITGYYARDGSVIMDRWKIMRRYVYSWLLLDCLVVSVDWIELMARSMSSEVGYARIGKVGRSFRIIRMIRLLRLVRMREIVDLICERINSEKLLLLVHITKLMAGLLMVAHIVACIWYGIGNTGEKNSWVVAYEFADRPWGDNYAMSLHWSISQFAGGMDEITPENPGERIYAMVSLMITFVIAALFISSLTSSMTQLELLGSTNSQLLSGLRQYLHQRKISSKLSMRVQRNAQHQIKELSRNMPEEKIELLEIVSEPLKIELHFEIHAPSLSGHHFFRRFIKECPQVMRKVCHTAARSVMVSAGDPIFSAGTKPADPKMYFITDGCLEYRQAVADAEPAELHRGTWIAEAVLWVVWVYRGDLVASVNSSYCMMDAIHFQETVNEFHHHSTIAKAYAVGFVNRLNSIGLNVSDLHIPDKEEDENKPRQSKFKSALERMNSKDLGRKHQDFRNSLHTGGRW